MKKMGARSVADLVKMAEALGITPAPALRQKRWGVADA
jgi:hypothetical protein